MKTADMYEDITMYDLSINADGEISLPQEVADYFENELISVTGKDKVSLYTSQGWDKKEEELTKMLHDKPEYAAFLRIIISSVCTHQIYKDRMICVEDYKQQHIGITCPGSVTLLNTDGAYSLVSPKVAGKLQEEIEKHLFD